MNIISIGYGKENWSGHGVRIAAFIVTKPFQRAYPSKVLRRRGATQTFPASQYPDINGTLFLDTLEARDGDILMVQATRTWRGASSADAAIFMRVRSTGPMTIAHVKLNADEAGRLNGDHFTVFQGRADRMLRRDMKLLGFDIPINWADSYMNEDEVEEIMSFEQTDQGTAPKPTFEVVETVSGEKKVITVERSRRRIRVR